MRYKVKSRLQSDIIYCKSAFYKKPHRWNKTKLLMTGFECPDIFVIRCPSKDRFPKDCGPPLISKTSLGL